MAKLQKFLFDLDFGAPPAPPADTAPSVLADEDAMIEMIEEPPPPPPPTFSEEELALARDQAWQAGRQDGWDEAQASAAQRTANAMGAVAQQLQDLVAGQQAAHEAALRDAVAVAAAVARKLLPDLARRHGVEEVEAVVRECLSHLDRQLRVTIRVHPELLDAVKANAKQAADTVGFEGKLMVHADPRLGPGDCRVDWGDGGAERNQERIWAEIDAVVTRALAGPDGETELYPPPEAGAEPAAETAVDDQAVAP